MVEGNVLAALAHPLRRRLLDLLTVHGPCTVSLLAEHSGQRVGNISHHIRVLADSGLVEEVPELARDRRERWWRPVPNSLRWSAQDAGDAAEAVIATAAEDLNLDHQISLARTWYAARHDAEPAWSRAAFSADTWLRLTPEELAQVGAELTEVLVRWARRQAPEDGQNREAVFLFSRGFPGHP